MATDEAEVRRLRSKVAELENEIKAMGPGELASLRTAHDNLRNERNTLRRETDGLRKEIEELRRKLKPS